MTSSSLTIKRPARRMAHPMAVAMSAVLLLNLATWQTNCWRIHEEANEHEQGEPPQLKRSQVLARKPYAHATSRRARIEPELDGGGWRSVGAAGSTLWRAKVSKLADESSATRRYEMGGAIKGVKPQATTSEASSNRSSSARRSGGKLVEWDDDDLNEADLSQRLRDNSLEDLSRAGGDGDEKPNQLDAPQQLGPARASQAPIANRLVFHGQLRGNETRVLVAEGVELNINTHKPVGINRRPFGLPALVATLAPPYAGLSFAPLRLAAHDEAEAEEMPTTSTSTTLKPTLKPTLMITEQDIYKPTKTTSATSPRPRDGGGGGGDGARGANKTSERRELWNSLLAQSHQDTASSSSDWRPIVVSTRTRRSGKTQRGPAAASSAAAAPLDLAGLSIGPAAKLKVDKLALDYKWKPIAKEPIDRLFDLSKRPAGGDLSANAIGKVKPVASKGEAGGVRLAMRKIEQPFDSDDEAPEMLGADERAPVREAKAARQDDDEGTDEARGPARIASAVEQVAKWRPLEPSTPSDLLLASATTTEPTTTTTTTTPTTPTATPRLTSVTRGGGGGSTQQNGTEVAQKSASDLSYIYSSQPQPAVQAIGGSASYYSAYQQPAVQVSGPAPAAASYYSSYQQPSQPAPVSMDQPSMVVAPGGIIDTTSGQTPEMIADRTPEVAAPQQQQPQQDYYSMPQSVAAFQPAPAPPSRPSPVFYSNNNYAYDTTSYGAAFRAASQQQQPPPPAPVSSSRQLAPAPVVRQEHHYHYYNQQQQQSERSQTNNAQQQQQPQPTVIRELQPIMISQPVVQQQPASTQAPPTQIIREVVREVPVQAAPLPPPPPPPPVPIPTRVLLPVPPPIPILAPPPPPPPIAIPALPAITRDTSFDSYASAYTAPAKRLMRQITNSIPQVAIRVPSAAQFRVQVPAIPLPAPQAIRAGAPVTRQTGSFIIPPMPKKTTTLLTETQAMPTHTTIMQTTQFTPATRTTVYTTDHQVESRAVASGYK